MFSSFRKKALKYHYEKISLLHFYADMFLANFFTTPATPFIKGGILCCFSMVAIHLKPVIRFKISGSIVRLSAHDEVCKTEPTFKYKCLNSAIHGGGVKDTKKWL